ncbi:MAG TPA: FAD-binding and (Fe-S)-binding domain-containing protein [Gaiellaceae bacterium]|nr:FAD-binding and (Fe-S)-binding domain-containing protein [Gaiellaceae bacterium]
MPSELEADLRAALEGEVRFSDGDRALYSSTGSNYRQLPIGVVVPRTVDDVVAAVGVCRDHGAPVVSRGGGTSLAGQAVNVAVVIDFSKYLNRILELDPERRLARVEPGAVLDRLREAAEEHGLTFGPDPSTHEYCTLGGMIGANSCGVRSVMAQFHGPGPRTSDNVHELDVLTYRGERLRAGPGGAALPDALATRLKELSDRYGDLVRERYPRIPRRVSGYNLDDLLPEEGFHVGRALAGTEGTCVTVLEATVHLIESPPCRALVAAGYEDAAAAADHVAEVLEHRPLGVEGVDDVLIEDMTLLGKHVRDLSLLPDGRGWLLVEVGGATRAEAEARGHDVIASLERAGGGLRGTKLYDDPASERHVWEVREAGLGATAFLPGRADSYEGWEDSAVPPERLGDYLRALERLAGRYGYRSALYGHFGQGCVHARWNFDLTSAPGIARWRAFLEDASDLVLSFGGSLSGEHGDGQARAELLPKMFGDELVEGFREFKSLWDPDWKLNPGKVVAPRAITSDLRLGPGYRPARVRTHFAFSDDGGSFAHATVRCVGVGKCRRTKGGVMCPSYMVTREEKHSTRGRAHLLWELLQEGELGGRRARDALDALDLCLACKGCTSECPVNVDMPALKAELLAHHYRRRLRPRQAYAFGLIDRVAALAAHAPGAANLLTQAPGLSALAKRAAGAAPERRLPPFAAVTLQAWFARRPRRPGGAPVLLWPDTFTNHFEPEVGIAAVEELEEAGFQVRLPSGRVCCGRPLYDYGFLGLARRYLERTLAALREEIRAGVPVVGLEPSCVAVFRDELPKMLPHDEDAARLARQAFHLAELLADADGYRSPAHAGRALLHGHCHARATNGFDAERLLLERAGFEVEAPDTGCCGMAGAWGYERAHYDVSVACAERALLPALRAAPAGVVAVASGFSCRSQIAQVGDGQRALHVAQALRLARRCEPAPSPGRRAGRGVRGAAAAAVAGLAAAEIARRRR